MGKINQNPNQNLFQIRLRHSTNGACIYFCIAHVFPLNSLRISNFSERFQVMRCSAPRVLCNCRHTAPPRCRGPPKGSPNGHPTPRHQASEAPSPRKFHHNSGSWLTKASPGTCSVGAICQARLALPQLLHRPWRRRRQQGPRSRAPVH